MKGNLVEIFWSVQGEGPWVGRPTVFVRLGECDLRCRYCDSAATWKPARTARIEIEAGRGRFESVDDPVPVDVVVDAVARLASGPDDFVSLTGGEPLLQPEFVRAIAAAVKRAGFKTYLETHGLHADAFSQVADVIDCLSMDWKLESDVSEAAGSPAGSFADRHLQLLEQVPARMEAYVKVVLTPATQTEELEAVCRRLSSLERAFPLVLQPVTPALHTKARPDADRLLDWMRRCRALYPDVRLVPQTHPIYGAL